MTNKERFDYIFGYTYAADTEISEQTPREGFEFIEYLFDEGTQCEQFHEKLYNLSAEQECSSDQKRRETYRGLDDEFFLCLKTVAKKMFEYGYIFGQQDAKNGIDQSNE